MNVHVTLTVRDLAAALERLRRQALESRDDRRADERPEAEPRQ